MIINFIKNIAAGGDPAQLIMSLLITVIALLFSLTVHEVAHGWIAKKCGDQTASMHGRLTLNPVAHLDPIGALSMLLVGYGWAKPVPVNYRNLRKPRRDIAFVALAGPISNLLLACVFAMIYTAIIVFAPATKLTWTLIEVFYIIALINIGLAMFNLIPIPPLDGSKVVSSLLPNMAAAKYLMWERYFGFIMLILILGDNIPGLDKIVGYFWLPFNIAREWIFLNLQSLFVNMWLAIQSLF